MTKRPITTDPDLAFHAERVSPSPFFGKSDLADFYIRHPVRLGDLDFSGPDGESRTKQEFAEECDINTIMERYEATGVISHVNRAEPMWLDTTDYPTLQGAMDLYREAATSFNALPAKVRKEFDNDPQKFIDFAANPENLKQMREWGLAEPEKAPEPPVRVVLDNPPPLSEPPKGGDKPA